MSSKYKATVTGGLYFITITVVDWVDLLTRPVCKEVIMDSFKYCQKHKALNLHAYVIMTNHVHAIVSSGNELSSIIRDFKKHTSKALITTIKEINESRKVWMLKKFEFAAKRVKKGVNYKVWQDGFHPVHLSSASMVEQKLSYIHNNPVVEGYVYAPENYVYGSAGAYCGLECQLTLQML